MMHEDIEFSEGKGYCVALKREFEGEELNYNDAGIPCRRLRMVVAVHFLEREITSLLVEVASLSAKIAIFYN